MESHAEDTPLSPHERDVLAALDRDLSRDEPNLARQLRVTRSTGIRRHVTTLWFGGLLMTLGLALVAATVMVSALVAFAGVVVMAAGAAVTAHTARGTVARLTRQLSGRADHDRA